ncbi:hypothetical protein BD410DRAFT_794643 [Rickenella mellea]|uniref:Uncharacterized protein n=1 Tax=Rickenella mellea TaxID=50990 RepID=A0A4Y7PPG7_9AGAM|nr:hypothetical protein BD410DRAFT_794643 [Rickenella mellea]
MCLRLVPRAPVGTTQVLLERGPSAIHGIASVISDRVLVSRPTILLHLSSRCFHPPEAMWSILSQYHTSNKLPMCSQEFTMLSIRRLAKSGAWFDFKLDHLHPKSPHTVHPRPIPGETDFEFHCTRGINGPVYCCLTSKRLTSISFLPVTFPPARRRSIQPLRYP